MRPFILFGLILSSSILLAPTSASTSQSLSAGQPDFFGRTVKLARPAERIVALFYGDAEMLCAIGAGEAVVGLGFINRQVGSDILTRFCPKILNSPEIGRGSTINLESLVSLRPDLVVGENDLGTLQRIETLGIPTFASFPKAFDDIRSQLVALGRLAGRADASADLATYLREVVAMVGQRLRSVPVRPRVYYVRTDLLTTVSDSVHEQIVNLAGGALVSAPGPSGSSVAVSLEHLLTWQPEVIIIRDRSPMTTAAILSDRRIQSVPAVKNRRVYKEHIGWVEYRLSSVFGIIEKASWLHPALIHEHEALSRYQEFLKMISNNGKR